MQLNFLSTYVFVDSFIMVFGDVKVELGSIESCSSNSSFSSGSNLSKDDSATPSDIA